MASNRLLIIDSDRASQDRLRNILLIPHGYIVESVIDIRAGYEIIRHQPPDLILLNVKETYIDDLRLLSEIRKNGRLAPVILIADEGVENAAVETFYLGARDCLRKPFIPEDVNRVVAKTFEEAKSRIGAVDLNRKMITAETVQYTIITLSHYLNNHTMAISGVLTLLDEALHQENSLVDIEEVIQTGKDSVRGIQAVLRVLTKITDVKLESYSRSSTMIDIAGILQKELEKNQ